MKKLLLHSAIVLTLLIAGKDSFAAFTVTINPPSPMILQSGGSRTLPQPTFTGGSGTFSGFSNPPALQNFFGFLWVLTPMPTLTTNFDFYFVDDVNHDTVMVPYTIIVQNSPAPKVDLPDTIFHKCGLDTLDMQEIKVQSGNGLWNNPGFDAYSIKFKWTPSTGLSCDTCWLPRIYNDQTIKYKLVVSDDRGNIDSAYFISDVGVPCTSCSVYPPAITGNPTVAIIPVSGDSLICGANGEFIRENVQTYVDSNITFGPFPIEHIRIDSITGLPCGLSWFTRTGNNIVLANGQRDCVVLQGTINDVPGQYKLNYYISLFAGGAYQANPFGSYSSYARVLAPGGICTPQDTSQPFMTGCSQSGNERIIQGRVDNAAGAPLHNSKVLLLHINTTDSIISIIDSTLTDANGLFSFFTDSTLVYAKAIPDLASYPLDLPTYYGGSPFAQQATSFTVNPGVNIMNFATVAGVNPGGAGFIGGNIYLGAGKRSVGDPVAGLMTALINTQNSSIVAYSISDSSGLVSFPNLPDGTYAVYVDKLGVNNALAPVITLAGTDNNKEGLRFTLLSTQLILEDALSATAQTDNINLVVVPNPFRNDIQVLTELNDDKNVSFTVKDVCGKVVAHLYEGRIPAGKYNFRFSLEEYSLTNGIYLFEVKSEKYSRITKLIRF